MAVEIFNGIWKKLEEPSVPFYDNQHCLASASSVPGFVDLLRKCSYTNRSCNCKEKKQRKQLEKRQKNKQTNTQTN